MEENNSNNELKKEKLEEKKENENNAEIAPINEKNFEYDETINPQNIKFSYEAMRIESAFSFKDGDLLVFGILSNLSATSSEGYSSIFESKTFKLKLNLNLITSSNAFHYLTEELFGVCKELYFGIYKFINGRLGYEEIQKFDFRMFETVSKLILVSNNDLLSVGYRHTLYKINVYRKEPVFSTKLLKEVVEYKFHEEFSINEVQELIEINNNELFGYQKSIIPDSISFFIFENKTYKVLKQNTITCETSNGKRIYITHPIIKVSKNKVLSCGCSNAYIFNLDTLELETIIQMPGNISKVLLRQNGLLLFLMQSSTYFTPFNRFKEINVEKVNHHFYEVKMDYNFNEITQKKRIDFGFLKEEYESLFEYFNYSERGLIIVTDKTNLTIFEP